MTKVRFSRVFALPALLLGLAVQAAEVGEWQPLFNGKDLTGWQVKDYAGPGEIKVEDGGIKKGMGVAPTRIVSLTDGRG